MKIPRLKNSTTALYCWTLVLFFPLPTLTQNHIQIQEWLKKSSDALCQKEPLTVDFTLQIFINQSAKISRSINGKIECKNSKFHLEFPDMEIWFDGKNQWTWQKGIKEVNLTQPTKQEIQTLNPMNIFNSYQPDWGYKNNGEKKDINQKIIQEIELIPKSNLNNQITKIILQINPKDFLPRRIQLVFRNKMENIIVLNKYQKNKYLSDQHFIFDPKQFPNMEIIDLRF